MRSTHELARFNMVENQVRPWEVLDPRTLETLAELRREDFVPPRLRELAYADMQLPLDHGQAMFKPNIEGRILQALAPAAGERVLEIGTGSGYTTACLARLAAEVVSVEIHADLADAARTRLAAAQVNNARVEVLDALADPIPGAPFDAVLIGGGLFTLPDAVRALVRPGGRLLAFTGRSPVLEAALHTRIDERNWTTETLFDTDLPYLQGGEPPSRFTL